MRSSLMLAAAVATGIGFACSQPSPSAPSDGRPVALGGTMAGTAIVPRGPSGPPIEPLLARLNLVTNHLVSANHQLDLYLVPNPPPIVPPNPLFLRNALDFYLKA